MSVKVPRWLSVLQVTAVICLSLAIVGHSERLVSVWYYNIGHILASRAAFADSFPAGIDRCNLYTAESWFRKGRRLDYGSEKVAESYYSLGMAYDSLRCAEQALIAFGTATSMRVGKGLPQPKAATAHSRVGFLLLERGELEEGISHLEEASSLGLGDPEFEYQVGLEIYSLFGDVGRATYHLEKAIQLHPGYVPAYGQLVEIYLHTNMAEAAMDWATRLVSSSPEDDIGYFFQGKVYRRQGHRELAIGAFQRAVELNPLRATNHFLLAVALSEAGQHNEAISEYLLAIDLDPTKAKYYRALGDVYRKLGRFDQALSAYREAVALAPEDVVSKQRVNELERMIQGAP